MFDKLVVIAISLNIALFIAGCGGEQTPEDQIKTSVSKMIYLLEERNIEEFIEQYSYSKIFEKINNEIKSEKNSGEVLENILINTMSNKIIEDLKEVKNISPKIRDDNQSAKFYIKNQIVDFVKIDGNWRLNLDTYLSNPAISPYIYTLY